MVRGVKGTDQWVYTSNGWGYRLEFQVRGDIRNVRRVGSSHRWKQDRGASQPVANVTWARGSEEKPNAPKGGQRIPQRKICGL